MLLELRVKDLGIIDETRWNLSDGLNVITGETGAGKSLVIDAVEALLGGRTDEGIIRHGSDEAQIEGVFDLPRGDGKSRIETLLQDKGIMEDDETMVINCAIRRQGRSIFRINGHAVPKGLLHQIGRLLIDIHGQSEHMALLERKYHLDFLDAFGGILNQRQNFGARAADLHRLEAELESLIRESKDSASRQDFLSFQIAEIEQARLREGEEEELDQERQILSSVEKIKALSYGACRALCGDDISHFSASVIDGLSEAVRMMKELVEIDPALRQQTDFLEQASYGLEEAARDISSYSEALEFDPQRLAEIESRLEFISGLKRKYGGTIPEMLSFLQKAQAEMEGISCSSQRQNELEQECVSLRAEMGQIAVELSRARSEAAKRLAAGVRKELHDLNMAQVEFEVSITPVQGSEVVPLPGGELQPFSNEGIDTVEFMAATNPGEPLKPLAKIASTGETSRFMLALKGVLSQSDDIPVVVFDEIDIGVGGRSGEILGKKLWMLARDRQVICITHLPQIASFADAHYSVYKEIVDDRTTSLLQTLRGESRIEEIAAMLAGPQFTQSSRDSASELMLNAERLKRDSDNPDGVTGR
ncbi:MAG: DNA repair protein RecN [Chloroflexota bacterium]|nr:DNA repair protein RecN [Chloroflexota bacterium]